MGRRCLALALCGLAAAVAAQQGPLPTGFGSLSLGMPWTAVESAAAFTERTRPTSEWERHVYDCGYRSARIAAEGGSLLVTAQDATVTELSYATAIEEGSNVMQVAQLVIESYGQPRQATLRDALGVVTIDQARANHVLLEYQGPVQAQFSVSGEPLWEYRITISDPGARRLENRTLRCAREREKKAGPAQTKKTS